MVPALIKVIDDKQFCLFLKDKTAYIYNNANLLDILGNLKIKNFYCWDAGFFLNSIIILAKNFDIYRKGNKPKKETIKILKSDNTIFSVKIWKKVKLKNTRHYKLWSFNLINFQNFFGGLDFKSVLKSFSITNPCDLIEKFCYYIKQLTNISIIDDKGFIKCFSMGAIAKKYYLYLKFPQVSDSLRLKNYQSITCFKKNDEYFFRENQLLVGGLLYIKDFNRHKNVVKIDINSLFPFIEKNAPCFERPIKIKGSDYNTDENYSYIIVVNSIILKSKYKGSILSDLVGVYHGKNKNIIELKNQAFFNDFFDLIQKFYDIIDIDINCFFKTRRIRDKAIRDYVEYLYPKKYDAPNLGLRFCTKFLINNLHGKFAELCLKKENNELVDYWEQSHFDYIRGAYIYQVARCKILSDYLNLIQQGYEEKIYYIDTDCFIADKTILDSIVTHPTALGAYKLEAEAEYFQAFAPKTYVLANDYDNIKLVAAGINSADVLAQAKTNIKTKTIENLLNYLADKNNCYTTKILVKENDKVFYKEIVRPLISYQTNDNEIISYKEYTING